MQNIKVKIGSQVSNVTLADLIPKNQNHTCKYLLSRVQITNRVWSEPHKNAFKHRVVNIRVRKLHFDSEYEQPRELYFINEQLLNAFVNTNCRYLKVNVRYGLFGRLSYVIDINNRLVDYR